MKNVMRIVLISMIALFVGCAQTYQARKVETSGFLEDSYSLLQEGKKGEAQLIYINPDADFAAYDKIMLDPVGSLV